MAKKSMNKTENSNNKKNVWKWIHRNRLLILIVTFLVVVPLALVITSYVGTYVGSQKFYFAEELTDDVERIKDFDSTIIFCSDMTPIKTSMFNRSL